MKFNYKVIICLVVLLFSTFTVWDLNGNSFDFSDRQLVLVVTDSMDGDVNDYDVDSYPADTLAMIEFVPEHEVRFIRVGQVAAYYSGDMLITHRVTGIDKASSSLIVKGDNSTTEEKVDFKDVIGVVVGTNHWLGVTTSFLKTDGLIVLYSAIGLMVAVFAIYGYRHLPEKKNKGVSKPLTFAVTLVAVVGLSFAGVGYAYTASTENADNTVSSTYVVLSQSNHTFKSNGYFEYYSITTGSNPYYLILDSNGNELADYVGNFWGKDHYGIKVGTTELTADISHYSTTLPTVTLTLSMPAEPTKDTDNGFTKYSGGSGSTWRYLLKMYYKVGNDETDVHWFWSKGNGWNDFTPQSKDTVVLQTNQVYTVELYYAAPGGVFNGEKLVSQEPIGYSKWNGGKTIIKNGWTKFIFET